MKTNFWFNRFRTLYRMPAVIAAFGGIAAAYNFNWKQPTQAEE